MCKACSGPGEESGGEIARNSLVEEGDRKNTLRNPIHPSIVDRLDPAFVKLYNNHIANNPPQSADINIVRQNYSSIYSYATAPATGVGGIGETQVPGWEKYVS